MMNQQFKKTITKLRQEQAKKITEYKILLLKLNGYKRVRRRK